MWMYVVEMPLTGKYDHFEVEASALAPTDIDIPELNVEAFVL